MSDRNQHCFLLDVSDLHHNQRRHGLKLYFPGGFGTGYSSLCGTSITTDDESGYFTVCLDLKVMSLMLVK
jgi:hypothetical protein